MTTPLSSATTSPISPTSSTSPTSASSPIPPDYHQFWHPASRLGYSGTAIFTKIQPLSHTTGFPPEIIQQFTTTHSPASAVSTSHPVSPSSSAPTPTPHPFADAFGDTLSEGRLQTLEFPDFFLVNVYTPNSKSDLARLNFRHQIWDPAFLAYLRLLEKTKPVITCGDFNAAHQPIDLARPKENQNNAGFTQQERQGIDHLTTHFLDTFRTLHPTTVKYTWWSHFGKARQRNVGWRIDYFFLSKALKPHLVAAEIHDHLTGSDHCPISISLKTPTSHQLTLFSWNLNGIRAVQQKNLLAPFLALNQDIICLQEIKSTEEQFLKSLTKPLKKSPNSQKSSNSLNPLNPTKSPKKNPSIS